MLTLWKLQSIHAGKDSSQNKDDEQVTIVTVGRDWPL
jgi:hypothetical protein